MTSFSYLLHPYNYLILNPYNGYCFVSIFPLVKIIFTEPHTYKHKKNELMAVETIGVLVWVPEGFVYGATQVQYPKD